MSQTSNDANGLHENNNAVCVTDEGSRKAKDTQAKKGGFVGVSKFLVHSLRRKNSSSRRRGSSNTEEPFDVLTLRDSEVQEVMGMMPVLLDYIIARERDTPLTLFKANSQRDDHSTESIVAAARSIAHAVGGADFRNVNVFYDYLGDMPLQIVALVAKLVLKSSKEPHISVDAALELIKLVKNHKHANNNNNNHNTDNLDSLFQALGACVQEHVGEEHFEVLSKVCWALADAKHSDLGELAYSFGPILMVTRQDCFSADVSAMDTISKTKYMKLVHEVDSMVRTVEILIKYHSQIFEFEKTDVNDPKTKMVSRVSQPDTGVEEKEGESTVEAGVFGIAKFSFKAEAEGEMCLQAGEIVRVLEQREDGWWLGCSEGGCAPGLFPGSYCTLIEKDNIGDKILSTNKEDDKVCTKGVKTMHLDSSSRTQEIDQSGAAYAYIHEQNTKSIVKKDKAEMIRSPPPDFAVIDSIIRSADVSEPTESDVIESDVSEPTGNDVIDKHVQHLERKVKQRDAQIAVLQAQVARLQFELADGRTM